LNVCPQAFRDLVHVALLTGCRFGELCRLKVADYNPDVGTLTIRDAKSGQARHVTLTGEAPELVERLTAGRSRQRRPEPSMQSVSCASVMRRARPFSIPT
jgi:integrase